MDILNAIYAKRSGSELSEQQIDFLTRSVSDGSADRAQISALLMAIFIHGMSTAEMKHLTLSMAKSGDYIEPGTFGRYVVDKHSTGGVGDKVTLVLVPLLHAVGLNIAKMSGRGLGHTGGTLDKLEIFRGFRHDLSHAAFVDQVRAHGMAIAGQTDQFVPADKYLYSLRDITGTVESLPLIASSIMSKKIACGADAILLDVKVGSGATLGNKQEARQLAQLMISIGHELGRKTEAVLTAMDQPLGNAVGNVLEVREAIETLQGRGPADVVELCLELGATMMHMTEEYAHDQAHKTLREKLADGSALRSFSKLIEVQGGDANIVDAVSDSTTNFQVNVCADTAGFIQKLDARTVGRASMLAGAGRRSKNDVIDPDAGIFLHKKVGDQVDKDEAIMTIYSSSREKLEEARNEANKAVSIATRAIDVPALILERIVP